MPPINLDTDDTIEVPPILHRIHTASSPVWVNPLNVDSVRVEMVGDVRAVVVSTTQNYGFVIHPNDDNSATTVAEEVVALVESATFEWGTFGADGS